MAALDNTLQSKYLTRPVVGQRNSVTLITWAGGVAIQPIPPTPDDAWVRQRALAESIPLAVDMYVQQTRSYFLQDQTTQINIRDFLSEDNEAAAEVSLAAQNDSILLAFVPRYANTVIGDQQVADWRARNNAPAPAKATP